MKICSNSTNNINTMFLKGRLHLYSFIFLSILLISFEGSFCLQNFSKNKENTSHEFKNSKFLTEPKNEYVEETLLTQETLSTSIETGLRARLALKVNSFLSYMDEYSKIRIGQEHIDSIKENARKTEEESMNVDSESVYAYFNPETKEMELVENPIPTPNDGIVLVAEGKYERTRYQTGWDNLLIKTYKTANPLIQCFISGYIEGILSAQEIHFYYKNIHVFFHGEEGTIKDIKNFYARVDQNIKKKISPENFEEMLRKAEGSKDEHDSFNHWSYITCLHAQINGLHQGYNIMADSGQKLDLLDFYFINSEGNYGDLKSYMNINKMDIKDQSKFYTNENLKRVYNTDNIEQIWKNLVRQGHCSALVKLLKKGDNTYDIMSGHNTWSNFCEMMRTLKIKQYDFEGDDIKVGMIPRKLNFSSYPGVLFSGDDFYELGSKVAILQTTLTVLNQYLYKDMLDVDSYIPEFMRIMKTCLTSKTGKEWVDNYSAYKNHMYMTQWVVIDYNVLKEINKNPSMKKENLLLVVEEVPGSILHIDLSEQLFKDTYFGSFNLPYFKEHMQKLGMNSFINVNFNSKHFNPRNYILEMLHHDSQDLESFSKLILYNGFKKKNPKLKDDPSFNDADNGICSRGDLGQDKFYHGGIDFKIVNAELVENMTIYAYGGPTYDKTGEIQPFSFSSIEDYEKDYHVGIPHKWEFTPFYFSEKSFK
jgi:hypothetical protein